jgi:hypothetical protein
MTDSSVLDSSSTAASFSLASETISIDELHNITSVFSTHVPQLFFSSLFLLIGSKILEKFLVSPAAWRIPSNPWHFYF